jgi:hypothetical protein
MICMCKYLRTACYYKIRNFICSDAFSRVSFDPVSTHISKSSAKLHVTFGYAHTRKLTPATLTGKINMKINIIRVMVTKVQIPLHISSITFYFIFFPNPISVCMKAFPAHYVPWSFCTPHVGSWELVPS